MSIEDRLYFRDLFRDARLAAYKDSEGFQDILFALERFGCFCAKKTGSLGEYEKFIEEVASRSPLYAEIPAQWRSYHLPFSALYKLVREARNDALHQGAYARHLTNHAVQLSFVIEDGLMSDGRMISDYMVREVVIAQTWQPLSFARQQMLANSFTYLPITNETGWNVLSDRSIAKYIQPNRKKLMAKSIESALKDGLTLEPVKCCFPNEKASETIKEFSDKPILVVDQKDKQRLLGIVTAFDLL
jgi:hypothetical protein